MIALTHHEEWAGGGYPNGLQCEFRAIKHELSDVVRAAAQERTDR